MFQRRALEMLNFALVCLTGYYLFDILQTESVPRDLRIDGWRNPQAFVYFMILMVFIYLSTHQTMLCIYNRMKSKQKESALNLRRQNVVLDELERQKRSGLINDPYTQALQQIIITEALTPKSKRKNMSLDMVDSAGFIRQENNTASKTSFKKLWSTRSLRKAQPNAPEQFTDSTYNIASPSPLLQKKLNPAPPPPINGNPLRAPVGIHTPKAQRKLSLDSKINNNIQVVANPVGSNLQKRIAELTTPKQTRKNLQGYSNPALTNEEQNFKRHFNSLRK